MIWIDDKKLNVNEEDRKLIISSLQLMFLGVLYYSAHINLLTEFSAVIVAIVDSLVYFHVSTTLSDNLSTKKDKLQAFNFFMTIMLNSIIIIGIFLLQSIP